MILDKTNQLQKWRKKITIIRAQIPQLVNHRISVIVDPFGI